MAGNYNRIGVFGYFGIKIFYGPGSEDIKYEI